MASLVNFMKQKKESAPVLHKLSKVEEKRETSQQLSQWTNITLIPKPD